MKSRYTFLGSGEPIHKLQKSVIRSSGFWLWSQKFFTNCKILHKLLNFSQIAKFFKNCNILQKLGNLSQIAQFFSKRINGLIINCEIFHKLRNFSQITQFSTNCNIFRKLRIFHFWKSIFRMHSPTQSPFCYWQYLKNEVP